MFSKPRSVRNRSSSSSGLIPASRRRNTFRISSSSKTIDVFDCSAPIGRASRSSLPSPANPPTGANSTTPSPAGSFAPRADHVDELAHLARVAERVEAAVDEQLVRLVRPGVEADLDELQLERADPSRAASPRSITVA